ncbi:MAG: hypothetical protein ACR652_21245 [Methylocystis sp.]|uniref:hypothetical protein n=1 Tax=Methylocystis sp. TaxID=1911079 RepID=UPI003DA422C8
MRTRLLASLIVCVALLAQFVASLWGAAEAREGPLGCHKTYAWSATVDAKQSADTSQQTPAQTPSGHDHATCSLCQLGFSVVQSEAPDIETRVLAHESVKLDEPQAPAPISVLNYSAPARGSPSQA